MKAISKLIAVCVAALNFSALVCQADVIYSNLGPYDTQVGGADVVGSAAGAAFGSPNGNNGFQLFSSGGNFVVTSITVGVDFYPPGEGFSPLFDAHLYSNVVIGNIMKTIFFDEPGTEIAEVGQALQAPNAPGLITFRPLSPISLSTNSLYWIILTPSNPLTFVVWDSNSLEVDGTLLTPEPSTLTLLACALPILLALRKKHAAKP
jgi:hypothetical protein